MTIKHKGVFVFIKIFAKYFLFFHAIALRHSLTIKEGGSNERNPIWNYSWRDINQYH